SASSHCGSVSMIVPSISQRTALGIMFMISKCSRCRTFSSVAFEGQATILYARTEWFDLSLPASFSSGRVMVVAFEGWNDAGDAASTVLNYFRDNYHVDTITEFDAEDYFDYQFNRPYAKINEDGERELIWPSVSLTVVH